MPESRWPSPWHPSCAVAATPWRCEVRQTLVQVQEEATPAGCILQTIEDIPGLNLREIADHVGASRGAVRHHIHRLDRDRLVVVQRQGNHQFHFATSMPPYGATLKAPADKIRGFHRGKRALSRSITKQTNLPGESRSGIKRRRIQPAGYTSRRPSPLPFIRARSSGSGLHRIARPQHAAVGGRRCQHGPWSFCHRHPTFVSRGDFRHRAFPPGLDLECGGLGEVV